MEGDVRKLEREGSMLRRYTSTLAVLDALLNRHLVLVSPALWDDRNDSYYLAEYCRRSSLKSVLALCLTAAPETYHHWKIFAGEAGACIVLHRQPFLKHVAEIEGLTCRKLIYRTNSEMDAARPIPVTDFPFLKRHAFKDEQEYRVIYGNDLFADHTTQPMPLPFELIDRIVLNPWTPIELAQSFATAVRKIEGCKGLRLQRSALIDNEVWKGQLDVVGDEL